MVSVMVGASETSDAEQILLIGASGLAREVIALLGDSRTQRVVAVLDDDANAQGATCGAIPIIGGLIEVNRYPHARVLVCVGSGRARERIVARLGLAPERYATILDPSVRNPAGCPVGAGSIILANATITADAAVGRHVVLMPAVTVTHGDRLDDFATLAAGVSLGGNVSVGKGAYLGMNSSVKPGLVVGDYSTLGMGAVLLRSLPPGETWAGVPAHRLTDPRPGLLVDWAAEASR